MPISFKSLSIHQLLRHKKSYELIDEVCSKAIPNWDIWRFERELYSYRIDTRSTVEKVLSLISPGLDALDEKHPILRYLEKGEHKGHELFLTSPIIDSVYGSDYVFWNIVAREFSDDILPMDKKEMRNRIIAVYKKFGFNFDNYGAFYNATFALKDGDSYDGYVATGDVRRLLKIAENRNKGFMQRLDVDADSLYFDYAKAQYEKFYHRYDNLYKKFNFREDFDIHTLCYAVDSSCTKNQRDQAFHCWGVITGKPLKYTESGELFGVTGKRIAQSENAVLRNSTKDRLMLFAFKDVGELD